MKNIVAIIAYLLLVACPGIIFAQIDYKGFPEWSLHTKGATEYALYTPSHLQPGKKYPIALFMHGCCGVDNHASLRNAVDPPARMWHQFGANKQVIPTYIIAPATARGWTQHFTDLKAVMDDLIAHHQGDPQRIYVCGFSMGGEGTFRFIQEYPGYFAAAISMGMNFHGDSLKVKDIPLWINQGETDPHSDNLRKQVAAIRALNGLANDTGATWITGINPRYSNFKGIGHGVQWDAASTQDLTGWAYSKINNGNKYPVVFFTNSAYPIPAVAGKPVLLYLYAADPDGSIGKINIVVNHQLYTVLNKQPYQFSFTPVAGDNMIEATAFDNKGKYSKAQTVVSVNMQPVLVTKTLAAIHSGDYYHTKMLAKGNGRLSFSISADTKLPPGIQLYPDGYLKGIPTQKGLFHFSVTVADENNQRAMLGYRLLVKEKRPGTVLVLGTGSDSVPYRVSTTIIGEMPFFNSKEVPLPTNADEINFSGLSHYSGLTYVQTNVNDANTADSNFLHLETDENVTLYVCYEKINRPIPSTIPGWLTTFKKEHGLITAQYRYFEVYSKLLKKGRINLPGADAKKNGVSSNYFIMLKKQKQ